MFDKLPSTPEPKNAGAFSLSADNSGIRKPILYIEDIYDPDKHSPEDISKYVIAKEGILVIDMKNKLFLEVISVAPNLKAEYSSWYAKTGLEDGSNESIQIFGQPGGFNQGERTLGIDYSILPNKANIDKRILCPDADYALLYLGNTFGDSSKIISATYANRNEMTSNRIGVKLASIDNRLNRSIMTTDSFSVTLSQEELPPGSRCTLVFYKLDGTPLPPSYILGVQHTAYLRDHNVGTKYITDIELLAPWFTDSNQTDLLMIPLNVPLVQVIFRAKVYYSDGSTETLPVDGTRFKLFGIEQFKPTSVGDTVGQLVLVYSFSEGEQAFLAQPGSPNTKSKKYRIQAAQPEGAYSPKIYTFPSPNSSSGYHLRHYLYTLDRKEVIDVTAIAKLNNLSPAYDPTAYGIIQRLIFNLRLSDANPLYVDWTLVQNTAITLKAAPSDTGPKWVVNFNNEDNTAGYTSEPAVLYNNTVYLNNSNYQTQEAWLDALYKKVMPQYQPKYELLPIPTHMEIWDKDNNHWRFALDRWDSNNALPHAYADGETLFLRWIKVNGDGSEQQLAMTGLYVLNATAPVIPSAKFAWDINNRQYQGWEQGEWAKES